MSRASLRARWWIARNSYRNSRDCGFPFMPSLHRALLILNTGLTGRELRDYLEAKWKKQEPRT